MYVYLLNFRYFVYINIIYTRVISVIQNDIFSSGNKKTFSQMLSPQNQLKYSYLSLQLVSQALFVRGFVLVSILYL
jgi:hypothetical protein